MEALLNGFTLEIGEGCFPLSSDSMALADFVKLSRNANVLDLGAGCGTLGILLCAGDRTCHVTAVEIDSASADCAGRNIERNGLSDRMEILCRDLKDLSSLLKPGSFSCCVSNPPYFSGGPASSHFSTARREDLCTPTELMKSAAQALKFGGDFYLVHKPEKLAQLIAEGSRQGLECKRLRLVRHRADGPVALVLLQLRKGAKPGLILEELAFYTSDGQPTEDYRRIYHMKEA